MVTFPQEHIRGRYAASLYRQMNFTELICSSDQEYVEKAIRLATNDEYYHSVRNSIRHGFEGEMRKNVQVSAEWLEFIYRALEE